ncbi:MAG: 3-phosphoshikimate 1-carboxyvinyltransferase [Clostridia bacterium]
MEKVIFNKAVSGGVINVPPSKSVAHRAMICAALSDDFAEIDNIDSSNDMKATMNFIKSMGKNFEYKDKKLSVYKGEVPTEATVDCIESGSTLRFIIPIMAALGIKTKFVGEGLLPKRPIGIYKDILKSVKTKGDGLPFYIDGKLISGDFYVAGNISSQFISGLLFALPLLDGDSKIILTTQLQSESYINITIEVMRDFGVEVSRTDYGYFVKGNQKYKATNYRVEGDWSQTAFFMTMSAFSQNSITLKGLKKNTAQGDKVALDIYKKMNVNCDFVGDDLVLTKNDFIKSAEVDVGDCPDIVPALSCLMALGEGTSKITNAKRLRIKESDRLKSVSEALNNLGAKVTELDDGLVIEGVKSLCGGCVNGYNDHRIVMAVASLRAVCSGDIISSFPHSINKSYPDFYKDYNSLGGRADVINMG